MMLVVNFTNVEYSHIGRDSVSDSTVLLCKPTVKHKIIVINLSI